MNLENLEQIKAPQPDPDEIKIQNLFVEIFHNKQSSEDRYSEATRRLASFLKTSEKNLLTQEQIDEITSNLKICSTLENETEFTKQCADCLRPLLDWKKQDPRSFEAKLRENVAEVTGFTPLNETLTYGRYKDCIHIHVSPSETLRVSEKLALIKDGFHKLRDILLADESIKEVSATSWIVAANPGILEKLGFTIDGEIPEDMKERHFQNETRPVFNAHITRDEFIDKYK